MVAHGFIPSLLHFFIFIINNRALVSVLFYMYRLFIRT